MKILVVFCHPKQHCFNRQILNACLKGLKKSEREVKVADLYAEGFKPAMVEQDFAQFDHKPMPDEILAEQQRVEWCDAIVFIFPLWWWSLPAMLKGWIDRIMSFGWVWKDPHDPLSGTLDEREILVMVTAGASHRQLAKREYDKALHTQLNVGTWDYCGFRNVTTRIFEKVEPDAPTELLDQYLLEAENLCASHFQALQPDISTK